MKEITIEELFNVKGGKRLPKGNLLQSIPNNHPYIRITDIKLNRILELDENFLYVPTNIQGIIKNYVVNEGDIVISIVGQIGLITRIGKSLNLANLTENCVKLIPKQRNIIDLNYILYYLKSNLGQDQILERVVGSTQPKLPIYNINSIVIKLPHIQKQQAIAGVLSALDDKIDLLQRQNQTLEQMAATLFRQWFIEEAQEDWEEVKISTLFEVKDGTHDSPKQSNVGFPLVTSKHLSNHQIDFSSAYLISEDDYHKVNKRSLVEQNDILYSMIGTLGLVFLEKNVKIEYAIKNIGLFKTSQNPKWLYYVYLWLKSPLGIQFIEENKSGSTQEYISLTSLRNLTIKNPPLEKLEKFNSVVVGTFEKVFINTQQIQTLQSLRDTLLPKLISGEIRLKGFAEKVDGLQDAS